MRDTDGYRGVAGQEYDLSPGVLINQSINLSIYEYNNYFPSIWEALLKNNYAKHFIIFQNQQVTKYRYIMLKTSKYSIMEIAARSSHITCYKVCVHWPLKITTDDTYLGRYGPRYCHWLWRFHFCLGILLMWTNDEKGLPCGVLCVTRMVFCWNF